MTTETAMVVQLGAEETALLAGDLGKLGESQRASLVTSICQSVGLNPLTRPFQYIVLNGKLTLYATKDCTDQLRRLNRVGTQIVGREMLPGEIYCVTARALLPDGRQEERIGAVSVAGLKGEGLANALMKAETKAVRRVTLGACGMGYLDESEVDTIPGAYQVRETESMSLQPRQLAQTNGQAERPPTMLMTGEAAKPDTITGLRRLADELKEWGGEVVEIRPDLTVDQATMLHAALKAKRKEYKERQRQIEAEAAAASRVDTATFAPLGDDEPLPF